MDYFGSYSNIVFLVKNHINKSEEEVRHILDKPFNSISNLQFSEYLNCLADYKFSTKNSDRAYYLKSIISGLYVNITPGQIDMYLKCGQYLFSFYTDDIECSVIYALYEILDSLTSISSKFLECIDTLNYEVLSGLFSLNGESFIDEKLLKYFMQYTITVESVSNIILSMRSIKDKSIYTLDEWKRIFDKVLNSNTSFSRKVIKPFRELTINGKNCIYVDNEIIFFQDTLSESELNMAQAKLGLLVGGE